MCRGANLGTCIAVGCDERIRCQDNGGYCDGHNPFDLRFCDCEDECTCPPAPPSPPVDEVKHLTYKIRQTEKALAYGEANVLRETAMVEKRTGWLKEMRARLAQLAPESVGGVQP